MPPDKITLPGPENPCRYWYKGWRKAYFQAWMPVGMQWDKPIADLGESAAVLAVVINAHTGQTYVVDATSITFAINPKEMPNGQ